MKYSFLKNAGLVLLGGGIVALGFSTFDTLRNKLYLDNVANVATSVKSPFLYSFNEGGVLEEAGTMYESQSPYWWLNSGGFMTTGSGIGQSIHGDLPESNKWHVLYAKSDSVDTDGGLHPQNLFRLITRSQWFNFRQEVYFRIARYNLSTSENRNESNGILLFNRYRDSDNLYYAGLRVDGTAVIKKKIAGTYYTLNEQPFFEGEYNKESNTNLLPKDTWIGVRTEVVTDPNSDVVQIRLYADIGRSGVWKLIAQAVDDGHSAGAAIQEKAYAGVRTDFMDVDFSDYKIGSL